MKLLRYLPLIAMVCALSGIAKADPIDFKLGVLDAGPGVDYTGTPLTNLKFHPCGGGLGPTYGCVTIENETGALLTNFQLEFSAANIQTAGACGSISSFFSTCTETEVGGNYIFTFSGGTGVGFDKREKGKNEDKHETRDSDDATDTFTIQEIGEPSRKDFGTLTLTSTPEPSSIWLMSTGALVLGAFFYSRRRNELSDQSL